MLFYKELLSRIDSEFLLLKFVKHMNLLGCESVLDELLQFAANLDRQHAFVSLYVKALTKAFGPFAFRFTLGLVDELDAELIFQLASCYKHPFFDVVDSNLLCEGGRALVSFGMALKDKDGDCSEEDQIVCVIDEILSFLSAAVPKTELSHEASMFICSLLNDGKRTESLQKVISLIMQTEDRALIADQISQTTAFSTSPSLRSLIEPSIHM
jgi:hypothetical protein